MNPTAMRAATQVILANVFESVLKPPGADEDASSDDAFFTGQAGAIVAQQIARRMAEAAVGSMKF